MAEIMWHRRETRRQTENTNVMPGALEGLILLDNNPAQFIRLCSTFNLAVAQRIASPWQDSSSAQTAVSAILSGLMDTAVDLLQTTRNWAADFPGLPLIMPRHILGFVNLLRLKRSSNARIVYPVTSYPLRSPLRVRDFGPALESLPHLLPVVRRR